MDHEIEAEHLAALREDLAYHQARVLLLVTAVAGADGHAKKLDGLTKLAKLDFLTRYPALAPSVLDAIRTHDKRLHLDEAGSLAKTDVESPMTRYKYGPWDDRYYTIIGALVGRGLLKYVRGRKGSVALSPTSLGKKMAGRLGESKEWSEIADRCTAIAEASSGMTGNALKNLIYERLAVLMDRPHREIIK